MGALAIFKRRPSVIPGFGITLGVSLTWLSLIVLIPLTAIFLKTRELTLRTFHCNRDQLSHSNG